jgi:DUF4097 and DUF4098 domain-containing protein YvlB
MLEIERNFQVADIRQIDLRIAMGDLSLTTGGDQVALRARVRSNDETELETTVTNGVLLVKNRSDNGWLGRSNSRIDVALTVPREAAIAVAVKTGLGDVNVEGVAGLYEVHTGKGDVRAVDGNSPLSIKTGKGDILVRTWRGDLNVTTGKGDVLVSGLNGALQMVTGAGDSSVEGWQAIGADANQIKTGSGDISISLVQAPGLKVSTGRGDCTLRRVALDSLRGQTGMGSFAIEGDPRHGDWELRTGKGDISLALPAHAAARVEAATRHGRIQSTLPQVKVARPGPASPHGGRTIVVIGEEPRAEVRLDTGKGDINIHARDAVAPPLPVVTVQQPVDAGKEALYAVRVETPEEPPQLAQKGSGHSSALTILESLSRGEISVDEAETLLRTLDQ